MDATDNAKADESRLELGGISRKIFVEVLDNACSCRRVKRILGGGLGGIEYIDGERPSGSSGFVGHNSDAMKRRRDIISKTETRQDGGLSRRSMSKRPELRTAARRHHETRSRVHDARGLIPHGQATICIRD
jgi:hypothetical protein